MQIWNDERTNIRKVPPKLAYFLLVLHVGEQTSHYQPIKHGFNQVAKNVALAVAQRVGVNCWRNLDTSEASNPKHLVGLYFR